MDVILHPLGALHSILHSDNSKSEPIRESTLDAEIRKKYKLQESFAISNQILFDMPLQTQLNTLARSIKHWLILVARYHSTTSQQSGVSSP